MSSTHGLIHCSDPRIRGESAIALATLVSANGGSSKNVGAKMIVGRSGRLLGGVTIGGCVDAQVIEAADTLAATSGRRLLSISLDDDEAWEIGLTCGGTLEVILDRVDPSDRDDPTIVAHRRALELVAAGETAVIVTPLDPPGAPFTVSEREFDAAPCAGRIFADHITPPATLVIVGAGEIAMALTRFAHELEMRTVIVDGRDRYATRERFPEADDVRIGMPSEIVEQVMAAMPGAGGKSISVVLVSHDYKYELPVLRNLLRSSVGYIGMLGSRKRGAAVRDLLRDEGFSADELARIHSPIGLDLGGKSSPEVALAILAEVVAVRNGRHA